ncbi:hypothetical protein BJ973_003359 [Actinoplanes tereljensis]|uniref:DUF4232 domain-containing protein n=1 Tax=Paractinoplanes tereljensis TaxID=571912 RepID=A0A919TYE0_9ACTN|nr:DUF4232 domain-containing protein [Actinoplanes tereljensis]GIF26089.1 hypothetical protein Ate02nite_88190 [Actinoplanes tereljensis]
MPSIRKAAAVLLAMVLATGCAKDEGRTPTEALSLKPDGSVPWLDEPIDSVYPSPATVTVAPDSPPCTAAQLSGGLDKWSKAAGDTVLGGRLLGELIVRNTATTDCVLSGLADVRLFSKDAEVPVDHLTSVTEEAKKQRIPVPAGGKASMRVDWSGPFCGTATPPYELRVTLPAEGGELRAKITPKDHPACSGDPESPTKPSSNLSAGVFDKFVEQDPITTERSPLWDLTASAEGPPQAAPGDRITYTITLTNPTAKPVTLLPCPGYLQELSAEANGMVNSTTAQLYRLNCRPATAVPARSALRFEMRTTIPKQAQGTVRIAWRIQTPQNLPSEHLVGLVTIPLT